MVAEEASKPKYLPRHLPDDLVDGDRVCFVSVGPLPPNSACSLLKERQIIDQLKSKLLAESASFHGTPQDINFEVFDNCGKGYLALDHDREEEAWEAIDEFDPTGLIVLKRDGSTKLSVRNDLPRIDINLQVFNMKRPAVKKFHLERKAWYKDCNKEFVHVQVTDTTTKKSPNHSVYVLRVDDGWEKTHPYLAKAQFVIKDMRSATDDEFTAMMVSRSREIVWGTGFETSESDVLEDAMASKKTDAAIFTMVEEGSHATIVIAARRSRSGNTKSFIIQTKRIARMDESFPKVETAGRTDNFTYNWRYFIDMTFADSWMRGVEVVNGIVTDLDNPAKNTDLDGLPKITDSDPHSEVDILRALTCFCDEPTDEYLTVVTATLESYLANHQIPMEHIVEDLVARSIFPKPGQRKQPTEKELVMLFTVMVLFAHRGLHGESSVQNLLNKHMQRIQLFLSGSDGPLHRAEDSLRKSFLADAVDTIAEHGKWQDSPESDFEGAIDKLVSNPVQSRKRRASGSMDKDGQKVTKPSSKRGTGRGAKLKRKASVRTQGGMRTSKTIHVPQMSSIGPTGTKAKKSSAGMRSENPGSKRARASSPDGRGGTIKTPSRKIPSKSFSVQETPLQLHTANTALDIPVAPGMIAASPIQAFGAPEVSEGLTGQTLSRRRSARSSRDASLNTSDPDFKRSLQFS
eukprot:Clim_evm21s221 gene=Clim_evmTU21s221